MIQVTAALKLISRSLITLSVVCFLSLSVFLSVHPSDTPLFPHMYTCSSLCFSPVVCVSLFILSPLFTWCLIHQSPRLADRQSSSPADLSHMVWPPGEPHLPLPPSALSVPLSLIFPFLCLHTRHLSLSPTLSPVLCISFPSQLSASLHHCRSTLLLYFFTFLSISPSRFHH